MSSRLEHLEAELQRVSDLFALNLTMCPAYLEKINASLRAGEISDRYGKYRPRPFQTLEEKEQMNQLLEAYGLAGKPWRGQKRWCKVLPVGLFLKRRKLRAKVAKLRAAKNISPSLYGPAGREYDDTLKTKELWTRAAAKAQHIETKNRLSSWVQQMTTEELMLELQKVDSQRSGHPLFSSPKNIRAREIIRRHGRKNLAQIKVDLQLQGLPPLTELGAVLMEQLPELSELYERRSFLDREVTRRYQENRAEVMAATAAIILSA